MAPTAANERRFLLLMTSEGGRPVALRTGAKNGSRFLSKGGRGAKATGSYIILLSKHLSLIRAAAISRGGSDPISSQTVHVQPC